MVHAARLAVEGVSRTPDSLNVTGTVTLAAVPEVGVKVMCPVYVPLCRLPGATDTESVPGVPAVTTDDVSHGESEAAVQPSEVPLGLVTLRA